MLPATWELTGWYAGRPLECARRVRHIQGSRMLNGEVIRLDGALRMPPR